MIISVSSVIIVSAISVSVILISLTLGFLGISCGRGACIKNSEIQTQMLK